MGHKMIVSGRVQGVFFRAYVRSNADKLGIKGTVQNLSDGTVEIMCDSSENFQEFLDKIKNPSFPRKVESVDVKEIIDQDFSDFKIIY